MKLLSELLFCYIFNKLYNFDPHIILNCINTELTYTV